MLSGLHNNKSSYQITFGTLIGSDTLNIQLACKCVGVGAHFFFEGVVNRHHPFVGMLTLPGVILNDQWSCCH